MDIIDHLLDEEEFLLNLKIESRRVKPVIPSATHCQHQHCNAEIPESRRVLVPGTQFCVYCQAENEKLNKHFH
ncbi:TraR/DksA C4-type zinc finger protein [Pectobacterium carotovorum]|uniref:TraR/DksA C4-type zinc finger protein n=1 Tax=Pectobacterium carotovorum TaxID=554 RepID=UPI0029DC0C30|nr:TraR/DksA C4-type zinc finger protein [Pectobacterium carotovorum]MDX6917798.1 TraR/DksA C4-type zinc finger protein [Pectobacterium carotovorum]